MSEETVRIDISIDIQTEGVVDTDITVAAWNAMTDDERAEVVRQMWMDMASVDNGGISVVTEGAAGV
jgi:hypothetical protein